MGKPVWVRFVLVPGPHRRSRECRDGGGLRGADANVEWVEVLPFHQMGAFKWKTLGLDYTLADTPIPTAQQVQPALEIFRGAGCRAR